MYQAKITASAHTIMVRLGSGRITVKRAFRVRTQPAIIKGVVTKLSNNKGVMTKLSNNKGDMTEPSNNEEVMTELGNDKGLTKPSKSTDDGCIRRFTFHPPADSHPQSIEAAVLQTDPRTHTMSLAGAEAFTARNLDQRDPPDSKPRWPGA